MKVQQEKDYRLPYRNYGNYFGHVKKRLSDIYIEIVVAKLLKKYAFRQVKATEFVRSLFMSQNERPVVVEQDGLNN